MNVKLIIVNIIKLLKFLERSIIEVSGLYSPTYRNSLIGEDASIKDALVAITKSGSHMACIVDSHGRLVALLTDSDIRRALLINAELSSPALQYGKRTPVTAKLSDSRHELMTLAKRHEVREIPIIDDESRVADIFSVINKEIKVPESSGEIIARHPDPIDNPMFILAGGKGTRLRSVVNQVPKPLAKVGNTPIIETLIRSAAKEGVTNFIVSVNYMSDHIEKHIANPIYKNLNITTIKETKPLGTAGSLSYISNMFENDVIVTNADVLTNASFRNIVQYHKSENADFTCCVRSHNTDIAFGVMEISNGQITAIREKPSIKHFVNAGIYVIAQEIIATIPEEDYLDMNTLIEDSIRLESKVIPFLLHEYWTDIGCPEDYTKANREYSRYFEENT